jgi:hypothetical protein
MIISLDIKSFEFIQKLEGHQTAASTNAALAWLWHIYKKEL